MKDALLQFWGVITSLGAFQVAIVDGKPITITLLTQGIIIFLLGYQVVKRLSVLFETRLITRLEIDSSLKYTLGRFAFYSLLGFLVVFTLGVLGVPLSIFAVLGGALAIGVGFGSQNVVNNFISGLIVMIERPIRVGDFLELDNTKGTVEHIGARATRIKTPDNTHIIVPNSSFLEKNVLNWTLSDDVIRGSVKVGVAYGTDVEKTRVEILESIKAQPEVIPSLEIWVLFDEFGDNALNFVGYFWVHVSNRTQLRMIESLIRFRMNERFVQAGLVIAFPQRDVHLDTLKPLQIEMVGKNH